MSHSKVTFQFDGGHRMALPGLHLSVSAGPAAQFRFVLRSFANFLVELPCPVQPWSLPTGEASVREKRVMRAFFKGNCFVFPLWSYLSYCLWSFCLVLWLLGFSCMRGFFGFLASLDFLRFCIFFSLRILSYCLCGLCRILAVVGSPLFWLRWRRCPAMTECV